MKFYIWKHAQPGHPKPWILTEPGDYYRAFASWAEAVQALRAIGW